MVYIVSLSQSYFFGSGVDYLIETGISINKSNFKISMIHFTNLDSLERHLLINPVHYLIVDYSYHEENWLNELCDLKDSKAITPFKIISISDKQISLVEHVMIKQTSYLSFDLKNSCQGISMILSNPSKLVEIDESGLNMDDIIFAYYFRKYGITAKEFNILKLILKGNINKEISITLKLSEKTISGHRQNIYSKVGVKSLGQLYNKLMSHTTFKSKWH